MISQRPPLTERLEMLQGQGSDQWQVAHRFAGLDDGPDEAQGCAPAGWVHAGLLGIGEILVVITGGIDLRGPA